MLQRAMRGAIELERLLAHPKNSADAAVMAIRRTWLDALSSRTFVAWHHLLTELRLVRHSLNKLGNVLLHAEFLVARVFLSWSVWFPSALKRSVFDNICSRNDKAMHDLQLRHVFLTWHCVELGSRPDKAI